MKSDKICPRCGLKYSYIDRKKVGDQVYLYAVHYLKGGSKKKARKCYLGPEDKYIYVSKMHEFTLRGPLDKKRVLKYLRSLKEIILTRKDEFDLNSKKEIVEIVEEIKKALEVKE